MLEPGNPAVVMTSRDAGYVAAVAPISGRLLMVVLVGIAVFIGLLYGPVIGDRLMDTVSKKASKAAPRVFLAGLGVLLTGLVVRVQILDVAGAFLIGSVVLAAILDNY